MYSVITSFTIVVAFWITWNHFCCMHNLITSFTVVVAFWKGEENNNSKQIMFKILWNQLPLYPLNRYCCCNCFICAMLFLWHKCILKGSIMRFDARHCSLFFHWNFWLIAVKSDFFSFFQLSKQNFLLNKYLHFLTAFFNLPNQTWKHRPNIFKFCHHDTVTVPLTRLRTTWEEL